MAILLSDSELEALYGLPMLAFRAYVAAIRPRMDIRTGMVGRMARISYQALIEWCYVEPGPGRVREPVSPDQMYRAVRVLEQAGLVAIRTEKATKRLIFQCLLAETISHVQNKPATNPRLEPATAEASNGKYSDGEAATSESTEAATHRREELTPSTHQPSSSSTAAVCRRPQGGREGTPDDRPPQGGAEGPQAVSEPSLDTHPSFHLESPSKASIEVEAIWPSSLNSEQIGGIAAKLQKLGDRRQAVIDELAGHMGQREIKNPVRYVDFIISKALHPDWVPELAGVVRAARERAAANQAAISAARAAPPAPIPRNPARAAALADQLKRKAAA